MNQLDMQVPSIAGLILTQMETAGPWGAGRGQAGTFGTDVSFVSASYWAYSQTSGTVLYPDIGLSVLQ